MSDKNKTDGRLVAIGAGTLVLAFFTWAGITAEAVWNFWELLGLIIFLLVLVLVGGAFISNGIDESDFSSIGYGCLSLLIALLVGYYNFFGGF